MAQANGPTQDLLKRLLSRVTRLLARQLRRWLAALLDRLTKPRPRALLPPGAAPQRTVVPAYWTREPKFDSAWDDVRNAGATIQAVVIEKSWPQTAKNIPGWAPGSRIHLDGLPGLKLGYVSTRNGNRTGPIVPDAEILNGPKTTGDDDSVKAWYDEFGGHIDGVYFDELVLPADAGAMARATSLAGAVKAAHPGATVMILAGQTLDAAAVGPNIDMVLLWEEAMARVDPQRGPIRPYREDFVAERAPTPQDPVPTTPPPSWWKDPANRQKIAHVVHGCEEPEHQRALSLANERNAGLVFVMNERGGPTHQSYDHMPPYWAVEVRELDSYLDFGFDPLRALRAAGRYGVSQNTVHAWPNFEAAWYGPVHVRGTFLIAQGTAGVTRQPIALADLPGQPPLYDIPRVWLGAHQYARRAGYETAIPTFEEPGSGAGLALILFDKNLPWLHSRGVALGDTYEQPTFAEPGFVIRNINRVTATQGYYAGFPTFEPDDPNNPRGRTAAFNCYGIEAGAGVTWQDVPTTTYIAQL
jgi:hypothetical protein